MHSFIAVMLMCVVFFASNLCEARAASPLRLAMSFELQSLHDVEAKGKDEKTQVRLRRPSPGGDKVALAKQRPIVSLGHGRLSVQADDIALGVILAELESQGVVVRVPEYLATRKIRTHFTQLKLGVGLRRLLRGLSYVATFNRPQHPPTHKSALALAGLRVLASGATPEIMDHNAVATLERVPRVAQN